ncbi:unnamed protein product [Closterium sp. Naga37s-1]|nr:unnamed protein product [Closterium sp. Naga37s-1]
MFFVHMCVFLAIQLLCLHRSALHDINYHVVLLVCLLLLRRIVACFIDFHPPAANKASAPASSRSANGSSASSSFLSRLFLLSSRRNGSAIPPPASLSGAGNATPSAADRVGDIVASSAVRSAKEAVTSGSKAWRVKGKAGRGGDEETACADGTAARESFSLTGSGMVAGDGVIKAGNHHSTGSFGESVGSTIGAGGAGGAVDVAGSGGGFDSPEAGKELLLGDDSTVKGNSLLNPGLADPSRGSGHGQWEQHVFPPMSVVTGTCSSLLLVGLYVAAVALLALKLSLTLPWQSQLLLFVPPICYAIIVALLNHQISHSSSLNSHSHSSPPSSVPHTSPSLHDCTVPQQNPLGGAAPHAASAAPCQQPSGVHPVSPCSNQPMGFPLASQQTKNLSGEPPGEVAAGGTGGSDGSTTAAALAQAADAPGARGGMLGELPGGRRRHSRHLLAASARACRMSASHAACCLLLEYSFVGVAVLLLKKEAVLRCSTQTSNAPPSPSPQPVFQMHEDILVSRLSCCLLLGYAFVGAAILLLMKEAVLLLMKEAVLLLIEPNPQTLLPCLVPTSDARGHTSEPPLVLPAAGVRVCGRGHAAADEGGCAAAAAGGVCGSAPGVLAPVVAEWNPHSVPYSEGAIVQRGARGLPLTQVFVSSPLPTSAPLPLFSSFRTFPRHQGRGGVESPQCAVQDVVEWNPHSVPYSEGAIVQRGGRLFVGLGRFNTAQPGSLSAALLFLLHHQPLVFSNWVVGTQICVSVSTQA